MEIFTQRIKQIEEGNVKKKKQARNSASATEARWKLNRLVVDLPLIAFTEGSPPFLSSGATPSRSTPRHTAQRRSVATCTCLLAAPTVARTCLPQKRRRERAASRGSFRRCRSRRCSRAPCRRRSPRRPRTRGCRGCPGREIGRAHV